MNVMSIHFDCIACGLGWQRLPALTSRPWHPHVRLRVLWRNEALRAAGQESKGQATLDLPDSNRESMVADANMKMSRAAESAARLDIVLDGFMQAAFAAYIQANPAARERIEAMHLLSQLDDMRRRGVLATT